VTAHTLSVMHEAPTDPVLSLDDIKAHMRVEGDDDDALIASYVRAAEMWLERYTGRALMQQTRKITVRGQSGRLVPLTVPPVAEIVSVTYTDVLGGAGTVPDADYTLAVNGDEAGLIAPTLGRDGGRTYTILYRTGAAQAQDVPEPLRQAVRLLAGSFYEAREDVVVGASVQALPFGVCALAMPYRVSRF